MEEKKPIISPAFTAVTVFILIITGVVIYYMMTLPCPSENPEVSPNTFADTPANTDESNPPPSQPAENLNGATPKDLPDYLTPDQADRLESWGVNVDDLPKTIEGETEACLIDAVGEERAQQIISGAEPSAWEMIKASRCF